MSHTNRRRQGHRSHKGKETTTLFKYRRDSWALFAPSKELMTPFIQKAGGEDAARTERRREFEYSQGQRSKSETPVEAPNDQRERERFQDGWWSSKGLHKRFHARAQLQRWVVKVDTRGCSLNYKRCRQQTFGGINLMKSYRLVKTNAEFHFNVSNIWFFAGQSLRQQP